MAVFFSSPLAVCASYVCPQLCDLFPLHLAAFYATVWKRYEVSGGSSHPNPGGVVVIIDNVHLKRIDIVRNA